MLLPRGLREKASAIVTEAGSHLSVRDGFVATDAVSVSPHVVLTSEQIAAADTLEKHDWS